MKILLVEDDHDLRATLKEYLEMNNHEVLEAENGKVALDLLGTMDRSKLGLVLTDQNMPIMKGTDLALHMKTNQYKIPIICISTDVDRPEFPRDLFHKCFGKMQYVEVTKYVGYMEQEGA